MKLHVDFKSFKLKYKRPNKNAFPTGTRVYKGHQGKGKTLSLVHDVQELKRDYPNCRIWSNVRLNGLDYNYYGKDILPALHDRNGEDGKVIIIDEAHLYFNKKSGVSLDMLTQISQQRKERTIIFMTCQIWEDLDISLRKQVKYIIDCKNILNKFQINTVSLGESLRWNKQDGEYQAKICAYRIFKHNERLYKSYDTLQVIETNESYNRPMATATPLQVSIEQPKVARK